MKDEEVLLLVIVEVAEAGEHQTALELLKHKINSSISILASGISPVLSEYFILLTYRYTIYIIHSYLWSK